VNHTFRTPLTRINWISRELERDLPSKEKLLYLQNLNNATDKLLEIIDLIAGIKDIKNVSGYVFVATSLRDIVEKSIAKYREEINKKNITFQVSTFKDIPLLTIDLKKITFVMDTLIENAVIYTPKDGKILIDCILKSGNKLLFYITDTGLGLSFYEKRRIFSKFYRGKRAILAHPDGMGLRLYLSKQIIALHGGKIYAKSKGKDKGSVFFIQLPLNK
jgi:signal transduction histidine kinase